MAIGARAAINYARVEEGSYQPITADQISISDGTTFTTTNVQDALNAIATGLEWRRDEFGNLAPYSGDTLVGDLDWSTNRIITTTSADLRLNTEDGETISLKEMKDEIQMLKDEINNLKMLLLEN